jgi:hypothetical protein
MTVAVADSVAQFRGNSFGKAGGCKSEVPKAVMQLVRDICSYGNAPGLDIAEPYVFVELEHPSILLKFHVQEGHNNCNCNNCTRSLS